MFVRFYVCVHVLEQHVNSNDYWTFWSLNYRIKQCVHVFFFPFQAEKAVLDVGDILVGSNRSIEVPLVNNSPCPIPFCLSVQQILQDEESLNDPETLPSGIICCCFICGHFKCVHDINQFSLTDYLILPYAFVRWMRSPLAEPVWPLDLPKGLLAMTETDIQ